ncbi:mannose-1-phosphate guanylyltransferase/mannose-6-phosphate isomerase [Candidatus Thioglobus sp.]|nr:mannose-1-phosphate guanylyltransferase/mannose-6-phosphate isomerase [Candidatus Thioglobus sp.]
MIVPIILSGGSGTRLWPISRSLYPKQFINLINDTTLFQDTILRLPTDSIDPIIVCNEEHRFLAAEQLRQINKKSSGIILEPIGKNTAPAVALAALNLIKNIKDCTLLILSADHHIDDIKLFHKAIQTAESLTKKGKLVTFGVLPNKPETGYGYIEADLSKDEDHYSIKSFTEKPNLKDAQLFLENGNYFWNSGMFMFKASVFLKELSIFEPEILSACKKSLKRSHNDSDFIRIDNLEFKACPSKSIDYAVMEKTNNSVVVPLNSAWSDIGSWDSLWELKDKDKDGNVSEGDVILKDVKNTYASSSNRLVSAIGVNNLIIIDTQDSLLVANKEYSQKINMIVNKLNENNRPETNFHRKIYRPWGYFDLIDLGDGFQVKRLLINPGAKISLQKHLHRAEHWVVVRGLATITRGEKIIELKINQSTFIPKDTIHRVENNQESPLEIIEVQTGDYLGEDDIIRIEDDYDRS